MPLVTIASTIAARNVEHHIVTVPPIRIAHAIAPRRLEILAPAEPAAVAAPTRAHADVVGPLVVEPCHGLRAMRNADELVGAQSA